MSASGVQSAQRILCESLARELGKNGIHVAYVVIDAAIESPWLKNSPPKNWHLPREDYFSHPFAIADECYHVAHQHKSAWSFDVCIRPYAESW